MSEPKIVSICNQDLCPDLPRSINATKHWFDNLRNLAARREIYLFANNSHSVLPPSFNIFKRTWNKYLFPNDSIVIQMPYPDTFEDVINSLSHHDLRFNYRNPSLDNGNNVILVEGGNIRNSYTHLINSFQARYCLILAGFNTVLYLNNMVMRNTRMYPKLDFIVPNNRISQSADYEMDMPSLNNQTPLENQNLKRIMNIKLDVYRELDELVYRNFQDDFWSKIIYLIHQETANMLTITSRCRQILRPNPAETYRRIEAETVGAQTEIKEEIIQLLEANDIDEKTISKIYDLILQSGM